MESKEYIFICSENIEDLEDLHQLFTNNGVDSKVQGKSMCKGEMGLEDVLITLITSSIIPTVLHTINIWLQSRRKELTIIDATTDKKIHLISHNGKGFTDSEMEKIATFFNE